MFPTEHLNLLWLDCSQDQEFRAQFQDVLMELFHSSSYQNWFQKNPLEPYQLTSDEIRKYNILSDRGLVLEARLRIKINRIGEKILITDGAWVTNVMRVFPDPDESVLLLNHVQKQGYDQWADSVVDPGAGCGHTPIGFSGKAHRFSCDANVRALLYARINSLLNNLGPDRVTVLMNDMTKGFPSSIHLQGNVLFLANVPFAPSPQRGALAINSAGGKTGADLQLSSFQLVQNFHRTSQQPVKACFLTWTVGSLSKDVWEVPEICKNIFTDGKVHWEIVQHDYDAPELSNPSLLRPTLEYLARSRYAVQRDQQEIHAAYQRLSTQLEEEGHTHIAYGMLEVDLT